jgi:hypothetical protein
MPDMNIRVLPFREWLKRTAQRMPEVADNLTDKSSAQFYLEANIQEALMKAYLHGKKGMSENDPVDWEPSDLL